MHLARYEPAGAANRIDPLIGGYDLATLQKEKGSAEDAKPWNSWLPDQGSSLGPAN